MAEADADYVEDMTEAAEAWDEAERAASETYGDAIFWAEFDWFLAEAEAWDALDDAVRAAEVAWGEAVDAAGEVFDAAITAAEADWYAAERAASDDYDTAIAAAEAAWIATEGAARDSLDTTLTTAETTLRAIAADARASFEGILDTAQAEWSTQREAARGTLMRSVDAASAASASGEEAAWQDYLAALASAGSNGSDDGESDRGRFLQQSGGADGAPASGAFRNPQAAAQGEGPGITFSGSDEDVQYFEDLLEELRDVSVEINQMLDAAAERGVELRVVDGERWVTFGRFDARALDKEDFEHLADDGTGLTKLSVLFHEIVEQDIGQNSPVGKFAKAHTLTLQAEEALLGTRRTYDSTYRAVKPHRNNGRFMYRYLDSDGTRTVDFVYFNAQGGISRIETIVHE